MDPGQAGRDSDEAGHSEERYWTSHPTPTFRPKMIPARPIRINRPAPILHQRMTARTTMAPTIPARRTRTSHPTPIRRRIKRTPCPGRIPEGRARLHRRRSGGRCGGRGRRYAAGPSRSPSSASASSDIPHGRPLRIQQRMQGVFRLSLDAMCAGRRKGAGYGFRTG